MLLQTKRIPYFHFAFYKAVEPLTTDRLVVGAALGDVGAEHHGDSWVCSEAPGGILTIWIPTVVLSQVPGKHRVNLSVMFSDISACRCVGE